MVLCTVILAVLAAYAIAKIYFKLTTGWCKSQTCLVGKTALITGANTGIGYETALDFAKRGARVILACRSKSKAEEARSRIISETGNENIVVKIVDMASFDSVRAFAREINESERRLDILVNNAGIISYGDRTSKDGLPLLIQTNHFSGFLLTHLLLDLLKKSAPSRIVNVSSLAAAFATKFDVNQVEKHISNGDDYNNSKLCNVYFTQELAKKLKGTGVTVYSLHPGVIKTDIINTMDGIRKIGFTLMMNFMSKNPEEGAQTTIYCSVAKGIEELSGEHFADCKRIKPYKTALNEGAAKKLWEKSERIVKL
ncbi:retinol dehydrogenase 11 [Tribolium castaneum]|uniref:WW domain-containing oxidoreductase-like Protein n=1 Tax=Tribolium castaneum TaxID=7070 RepID=D6X0A8_TRICA|nr:PREDICTED: retinol dehydrogenase 11 [Tribolium castaneum]EFA09602.1 WW domain-containing oxidoreductase-like Protein [Tribolium castaneum]|eukprot:XP_967100.1 PREDICTED: retinol dehydrogenase 11 [Tribolium castaneum]